MNFQTALRLLLLSCNFTTYASAINNSMEGKKDEADSSNDALFVRKLLSYEEVGNGVTRYSELPQLNNWIEVKGFCTSKGLLLATKAQICPNGSLQPPVGGTLTGDQWVAIADGSNEWLQVGPLHNPGPRLCKLLTELTGQSPDKSSPWGVDNSKQPYESNYLYCFKTPTQEAVGNGVIRYSELPQLNNWNQVEAFCTDQGLILATKAQICPNGPLQPPLGGTLTDDQWVAIADGSNNWLQLGPRQKQYGGVHGQDRLCKAYKEHYGYSSVWGVDNSKNPYESNYLYCFKTPTQEPTMFPTSVPTSKPTTFIERVEAVVGDGCTNGIDFVTSFTTDSGVACDKVTFCNGSTSNSIFHPNISTVCIDFSKADEECTNFQVITTFDYSWRMNALSLTSSGMGAETDPEQVVMKGSNDMSTWISLYDSPLVFTERNKPETFVLANTDMFKYYSLSFERKNASSNMNVGHYSLVEEYTKSCSIQFFEGISDYSFE